MQNKGIRAEIIVAYLRLVLYLFFTYPHDQVDPALKQVMDFHPCDLLCLLLQGKQDIGFISQEALNTVLILKYRSNLHIRIGFAIQTHGFRQKIYCLADHHADGNIVFVFCAEILPLFYSPLKVFPHTGQKGYKLFS